MRIALVAPFGLRAKGTTRARVLPLGSALALRGHRVAVFIPPYDSPEDSGKRWEENGVDVINVALPETTVLGGELWYFRLAWRLLQAVRDWQPDVAHVFKPKGPSGLVGAALWWQRRWTIDDRRWKRSEARRLRSMGGDPSSIVVIDADDWEGHGGWNDDPRAGYSSPQRRFFAWQERYGLSHADAWTVTSACLRDRAIASGADPQRIYVLHNGIDPTSSRSPTSSSQPPAIIHPPSVLLYTRFAGVRVPDVVGVWERVVANTPEARLTVAGRGLAAEETKLAAVPGVEVAGWLEPGDLRALFGRMDVAVVPWADTPSNRARHSAKVLELMAAGLPVVAYTVGELPATLGDAGLLVPPGDAAAFARSVVALLGDRAKAQRLGACAKERVVAQFSWERLADAALAAYAAAKAAD